jgi:XTP/dITP diphosphohydrolase
MENEIIIATGNKGKLREIREILDGCTSRLAALSDYWNPVPEIPEDGETFYENAAAKANWVFSRTGKPALADDSGLEVDFLGKAPGVRSARFAGEPASDQKNIEKLLGMLAECPDEKRTARFKSVIVLRVSAAEEIVAEGTCEGCIGRVPCGNGGFGYDPVFFPEGFDQTFAQLDPVKKNLLSHRGKALAALKAKCHGRFFK